MLLCCVVVGEEDEITVSTFELSLTAIYHHNKNRNSLPQSPGTRTRERQCVCPCWSLYCTLCMLLLLAGKGRRTAAEDERTERNHGC